LNKRPEKIPVILQNVHVSCTFLCLCYAGAQTVLLDVYFPKNFRAGITQAPQERFPFPRRCTDPLSAVHKPVANADLRQNVSMLRITALNFTSKICHEDAEILCIRLLVLSPDPGLDIVVGQDLASVLDQ